MVLPRLYFFKFIQPVNLVENSFVNSFNGQLPDRYLGLEVIFTLQDVRIKLAK